MNNIKNISEFGLEDANILGFLNEFGYSDVHSWLLVKEGDILVGYEVERDFTPKFDGYYCYNNEEQRYAPLVLTGYKTEVTHRKVLSHCFWHVYAGFFEQFEYTQQYYSLMKRVKRHT